MLTSGIASSLALLAMTINTQIANLQCHGSKGGFVAVGLGELVVISYISISFLEEYPQGLSLNQPVFL